MQPIQKQKSFLDTFFQTQVPAPIPKGARDVKAKANWLPTTKSALLAVGALATLGGIFLAYHRNPTTISTDTIIKPSNSFETFHVIILGAVTAIGYSIFKCTRKNSPQPENKAQSAFDNLPNIVISPKDTEPKIVKVESDDGSSLKKSDKDEDGDISLEADIVDLKNKELSKDSVEKKETDEPNTETFIEIEKKEDTEDSSTDDFLQIDDLLVKPGSTRKCILQ